MLAMSRCRVSICYLALRCVRRKLGIDALDVIGPMDREALKDKSTTGKKETHTGSHKSRQYKMGKRDKVCGLAVTSVVSNSMRPHGL